MNNNKNTRFVSVINNWYLCLVNSEGIQEILGWFQTEEQAKIAMAEEVFEYGSDALFIKNWHD